MKQRSRTIGLGRLCLVISLSGLCCIAAAAASAQELRIAAASDLQSVFPAIVEQFERDTGRRALVTFGSSGNFFSQIQNGAPFDLFFSADIEFASRLQTLGLAEPGSLDRYANGRIALWSRTDSGINASTLDVLRDPRVRRIAIANPEHAPYGRAAVAALQAAGLYGGLKGKLVFGESVSQAAQFVQSGNADVGIIALSLALSPALRAAGRFAEVPSELYPPIEQAAIITRASRQKDVARQFLAFLRTPPIVQLMRGVGFTRLQ